MSRPQSDDRADTSDSPSLHSGQDALGSVNPRSDPLSWLDAESEERSRLGLSRRLTVLEASQPARVEHEGRSLINFASNDYLGLAADPRIVDAAIRAAQQFGWGAGASPLVAGWSTPHEELAAALADFEQVEA